jgi:hypothetical protein
LRRVVRSRAGGHDTLREMAVQRTKDTAFPMVLCPDEAARALQARNAGLAGVQLSLDMGITVVDAQVTVRPWR